MTGEPVTTLHDFQLSMLNAMCTSAPAEAAALLARVGATREEAEIAEKRWWFANPTNSFRTIAEYADAWGAPVAERVEYPGDREIRYAAWDLPFWPCLRIEWMELEQHSVLFRKLLRQPGHQRPQVKSAADLPAWSWTWDEFHDGSLGQTDFVDGWGAVGDLAVCRAIDPETGRDRIYWADFDWALLQRIERAPDAFEWPSRCRAQHK
ncbi:hypothetical protein [Nocardia acidivorans]|uniref:hypothetical protein n=1 Tax=Nocardia acidivorans TaxID=404580 RepID=UPI000830CA52|nr:hypothetical protein [Nocardia acidivorans]